MKYRKYLITGGAGFIGANLCQRLMKEVGAAVTVIDNYTTGSKKNHIKGVEYIAGDAEEILPKINSDYDVLIHMADYARVERSLSEPGKVLRKNLSAIVEALEYCVKHNAKLVYAGSSTKFGDHGQSSKSTPYGWSKKYNTELIKQYESWFGFDNYAICYFYNAYGPKELSVGKYATLIGLYQNFMLHGRSLPITLPGTQVRNFTHVDDIVEGIVKVVNKGLGDGFGIGSDKAYSIKQVADLFGGKNHFIPERAGNRMNAELVIEKTLKLGWKAEKKLEDYIGALRERKWVPFE